MQRRFKAMSLVVMLAAFSLTLVGCGQFNKLKAKKSFKEANTLYQQQDFKRAADRYEEVVANDPELTAAYFFLANSYDNLYKPSRKGDPVIDGYLTKAVENYKKSAVVEKDKILKTRSLQYLVAAYGTDKLDDPGQAEPLLQEMIRIDPTESSNYAILSKMYEDAGQYELAEQTLVKAKEAIPKDPTSYTQLAAFYNRQGEFEKTMQALAERTAREPSNPEGFYTVAAYYWEKAYRDFRLKDTDKLNYIALGMEAVDKAISLSPEYLEAINRKELLIRAKALVIKDPGQQKALLDEAKKLREQYTEIKLRKAGGK